MASVYSGCYDIGWLCTTLSVSMPWVNYIVLLSVRRREYVHYLHC